MRKRALANPPPELLCIPQRATTAALRAACTQTLRSTYRMLQKFQVRTRQERSLGLALRSRAVWQWSLQQAWLASRLDELYMPVPVWHWQCTRPGLSVDEGFNVVVAGG